MSTPISFISSSSRLVSLRSYFVGSSALTPKPYGVWQEVGKLFRDSRSEASRR